MEKRENFKIVDALTEFKIGICVNPPIDKHSKEMSKAPTPSMKQCIITCSANTKSKRIVLSNVFTSKGLDENLLDVIYWELELLVNIWRIN